MTRAAVVASARKELHALLPFWLVSAAAVVLGGAFERSNLSVLAFLGYVCGSAALGAYAVGHEYTSRTLGSLLALPVSRSLVLAVKFAVLLALLLALTAVAWPALEGSREFDPHGGWAFLLVLVGSLSLPPMVTMLSRNPVAGVVLGGAIPGVVWVGANLIGIAWFGLDNAAAIDRFAFTSFWAVTWMLCLVALPAAWWTFGRLEAIDGRAGEIALPSWLATAAAEGGARRRHPIAHLAAKELHLHQLAFALCGLFVLMIGVLNLVNWTRPDASEISHFAASVFLLGGIPIVIGSMASAEERQMGTLQPQLLVPMTAARQWRVKAGVAIGLALVLSVAVPLALSSVVPALRIPWQMWLVAALVAVGLTSAGLYVSSVSSSGLRALVTAVPVVFAAVLLGGWLRHVLYVIFFYDLRWRPRPVGEWGALAFMVTAAVLMSGWLLRAASVNHRSGDHPPARTAGQLLGAVVLLVVLVGVEALL